MSAKIILVISIYRAMKFKQILYLSLNYIFLHFKFLQKKGYMNNINVTKTNLILYVNYCLEGYSTFILQISLKSNNICCPY